MDDSVHRSSFIVHRWRGDVVLVAALATLTNFAYMIASNGDFFFPDSLTYLAPARNLLRGHGFATEPGVFETLRTPGYPLFLLPFLAAGAGAAAIIAVQHAMIVAMALGIYLLARARTSRFVALAAAAIFAIDTPSIHYSNKVLSETLFTAGLLILFTIALRLSSRRTAFVAGLLSGALVLVRPVAVLYFAVIAAYLLWRRVGWRIVAIFTATALLIPVSWGVRNRYRTGVFTISSIAGVNMLFHHAAGAIAITDGGDFRSDLTDRQNELFADANDEISERENVASANDLGQAVRSRDYGDIARRIVLQHPFGLLLLTVRGVMVNLFDSDWEAIMIVSRAPQSIIHLAIDGWTVAMCVLAVIGVIALWRSARDLAALVAATVLYFIVISAGGEAEVRMRVPIVPLYAIAAAAGLDAVRRAAALEPR